MPPESTSLRILIVDDEPVARRRLRRLLQNSATSDLSIAGECGDGAAAVAAIQRLKPEIVFLDVQMPGMDGFAVLRALGTEALPVIIFVTAYDQFALQAFEAQAVDYLLKPFGEERVNQALARARLFLRGGSAKKNQREDIAELLRVTAAPLPSSCLLVKRDDRVLVLQPAEIDWLEADGDYVKLHVGSESHLTRATLTEMERRLRPAGFVRIHRSRLVNLSRVKELRPLSRGESVVLLKNGVRLEASYAFMKLVQQQLGMPA
jgi:two-component system LytT family response regulator